MHEMSIAQSLFEIIEEEREKQKLSRITAVKLSIGEMTAVVPDALEFCFRVLAEGTPVEGARLDCAIVPLTGRCRDCQGEFTVENYMFQCPECRSTDVELTAGQEMFIDELEGE